MTRQHLIVDALTGEAHVVPFTAEEEAEADARDAARAEPVNNPLSDRQLRIGLITSGIPLDAVDKAIAAIPDATQRAIAQVWWDRSTVIHWDHPMRASLTALLGLTEEQAAAMWMTAKAIEA